MHIVRWYYGKYYDKYKAHKTVAMIHNKYLQ